MAKHPLMGIVRNADGVENVAFPSRKKEIGGGKTRDARVWPDRFRSTSVSAVFLSPRVTKDIINISTETAVANHLSKERSRCAFSPQLFYSFAFFLFISLTTTQELISPVRNETILFRGCKNPFVFFLKYQQRVKSFRQPLSLPIKFSQSNGVGLLFACTSFLFAPLYIATVFWIISSVSSILQYNNIKACSRKIYP